MEIIQGSLLYSSKLSVESNAYSKPSCTRVEKYMGVI
jgi:hypothetical protein